MEKITMVTLLLRSTYMFLTANMKVLLLSEIITNVRLQDLISFNSIKHLMFGQTKNTDASRFQKIQNTL